MPQDGVGGGAVEEHVRQRMVEEVCLARHAALRLARLPGNGARYSTERLLRVRQY